MQGGSSVVVLCYMFLVSVSMTYHLMCLYYFSLVRFAEWPPFGKELLIDNLIMLSSI